jgi:Carboxypeptidase regulatory-like domain/TonB dependent receptor-like, beta-barrel
MKRLWLPAIVLWFPLAVFAQTPSATGVIQGTVADSTGAVIVGVRVTSVQEDSGFTRVTETDGAGQFRFGNLAIGSYSLRFEQSGFTTVIIRPFLVSVGQTVVQNIVMKLAEVVQSLEVREQIEALDTAATSSSVALGYERIEETPAQNRNYLNFVLVAPAVVPSSGSNSQRSAAGARSPASDSGFSFGGLRGRNNSLSIDGVDNRDETTGGNRVAVGLEMVQEFRVSGTAFGAESGGAAGGLVNMVTRSGTNKWHGDGTFFAQNELFNARNPEALTEARPRFRRYQPGASINGPIRKDRTFFATAFEQEWESSEEWSESPESLLDAINHTLAGPEFSGSAVKSVQRGLFPASSAQSEFSFKFNHQAGTRHSLSARYAFSRGRISNDVQGVDNFSDRSSRGSSLTRDHSLVGGWTYVPSARVVNDIRVQIATRSVDLKPSVPGAMLEIPGVLTLGQAYRLDASRTEDHYEVVEGLNVSIGGHQLSLGGSAHSIRLDARISSRFGGIFVFPTVNDFLNAQPDVFIQAFGDPRTRISTVPLGMWLQDRWQLRPGLTLEAGLRYDRQRLPSIFQTANHNFAPRLGLAWRPSNSAPWVIRAGFGLFYDRYPLAFLNDAIQKDGAHGFEQYLVGEAAIQALSLSKGATLSEALSGFAPSIYRPDSDFPTTYSTKATAGLERSLGKDTTLGFEYSHVRGLHLPRLRNIAGHLPGLYQLEQTAQSDYNGVSVTLNRRMSRELSFLLAYHLGHSHDDASDFDEQPLDPLDLRRDWAYSRQHQAQRLAASALFELPVEEIPRAPEWLRKSLVRVTVAPIFTTGSGRPINALETTDIFRTGAFPISARPFGLARNPFLSPSATSLDLRTMKTFPFKHDRAYAQVGVEVFNLTNHSNPLRVSQSYAAEGSLLPSYGQAVETLNARQIQFLIQLEY